MSVSALTRKSAGIAGALALAAGLTAASATEARAAVPACPYPYVCFYNSSGQMTGQFQDVTDYYQSVGASANATEVYNTRYDDVARIRYSDGYVRCIKPRENAWISRASTRVTGIKISWSSTC
ncbi:hypothetical protein F0L17_25600 [Streptomyces sp. TRM43335]|uniref:Peptidase inhibitor family I36 n=1 Tax=Streptomyces taklimakanensis TaxID=2569853 RepID=A0A6G2BJX4_9ACTN|nr:hypothetical protein [Streptomyces taklimakanensis]MTE22416.1 hypothetical protein [Streptomyces taklimakanensis]